MYDVDTLFIIKKKAAEEDINLNDILQQYNVADTYDDNLIIKKGEYFGYKNGAADMIEDLPLHEYLYSKVDAFEKEITYRRGRRQSTTDPAQKVLLNKELKAMEEAYFKLVDVAIESAKNSIVDLFSRNIADRKNRTDLLTPISFARIAALKSKNTSKFLSDLAKDSDLLNDLIEDGIVIREGDNLVYKDQTFKTQKQFAAYVESKGLELLESDGPLGAIIVEKYSDKGEDSVAEMMTKLEAQKKGVTLTTVTQKDVDHYLYPSGQAHDYVTQSRIHANTYSGVKATGISANFSKMLAYLFSSTPITEIVDDKGHKIEVDPSTDKGIKNMGQLRSEYAVRSVQDLLKKNKNFQISKRANPKVKLTAAPIINNFRFDEIRRNEINYDGTDKVLFKNVPGKELTINVFETIDSIINLAIDNVKEQKLFLLGLTNSNANAMLTMLGMGVPLNDVVRFFKTPIIANVSKSKRIYPGTLYNMIMENISTLSDDDIIAYLTETKQKKAIRKLRSYASQMQSSYQQALAANLKFIGVDTKILDSVYVGNLQHKTMSDIAALQNLLKLVGMGSELFDYSQMFSLLRGLPSKKWKMDSLLKIPLKYATFKQTDTIDKEVTENMKARIGNLFMESEYYNSLPTEEHKNAALNVEMDEVDKKNSVYTPELERLKKAWFLNQIGKNKLIRSMSPNENSSFENVTILSLPHVYSAWRSLSKLSRIIEDTFAIHNPRVAKLASNVISKVKGEDAFVKQDFQEAVQQNFLKYLGSNLIIELNDRTIDLSVSKNEVYQSPLGKLFRGEDAWTQQFIERLTPLLGDERNELLKSIEIKTDFGPNRELLGKRLLLTADKVGEDELVEILKRDFLALQESGIADDLLKYAALTSGLYYGRTNFSLIFPAEYALAYDRALNARLESVLTKSAIKTDVNLTVIEDAFLYQFVRNNPQMLSYVSRVKPEVTAKMKTERGYNRQILHGVDNIQGIPVYYDLKFPYQDGRVYDNIIRRYGDTTYIKLHVPSKEFVYYRIFTVKPVDKTYSFDESDLTTGFDIGKLQHAALPVVTDYVLTGNKLTIQNTNIPQYKVGEQIFLNPNTTKFDNMESYTVEDVKEDKRNGIVRGMVYTVKRNPKINDIDTSYRELVDSLNDRPYYTEVEASSKYALVAVSQRDALIKADRSGAVAVVGAVEKSTPGAYNIDLTKDAESIVRSINNLPESDKYVIDKNIMRTLQRTNPAAAVQVATALYTKTGYVHEILGRSEEDVKIESQIGLVLKIDELTSGSTKMDKVKNWKVNLSNFKIPRNIKVNSIVYLGMSEDQHIFGHVTNIENNIATLRPVDAVLFDYLTERFYTTEQLDRISEKINPC